MSSTSTHRISTPSRIHFTLIDMNGEIGRVDGSLGLSLQYPGVVLDFRTNERTVVRGGDISERRLVAAELSASSQILQVEPEIEIIVRQMIPPHQGLGSGTQLRLAVLTALNHRFGLDYSPAMLAAMSTRGGTSGIGVNAFQVGGFLLDGGHSIDSRKKSFAPSHYATGAGQPPLLLRYEFPHSWGIALFIPERIQGLSGADELEFMLSNTPIPICEVQSVSHVILMRLLPALREADIEAFGSSVSALQETGWKRRHWSRHEIEPLQSVRSAFHETTGVFGCGLSSTGATIFGFFDTKKFADDEISGNLRNALKRHEAVPGRVLCTHANNTGMRLAKLEGE